MKQRKRIYHSPSTDSIETRATQKLATFIKKGSQKATPIKTKKYNSVFLRLIKRLAQCFGAT